MADFLSASPAMHYPYLKHFRLQSPLRDIIGRPVEDGYSPPDPENISPPWYAVSMIQHPLS